MVCSVSLSLLPFHTPSADWLDISTTNQHLSNNWFLLATQKAKRRTPPESAVKSGLENCVRLYVLFCLTSFSLWQVVLVYAAAIVEYLWTGDSSLLNLKDNVHIFRLAPSFQGYIYFQGNFNFSLTLISERSNSSPMFKGHFFTEVRLPHITW